MRSQFTPRAVPRQPTEIHPYVKLAAASFIAAAVLLDALAASAGPMRIRLENVATSTGVIITDNAGDLSLGLGSIVFVGMFDALIPISVTTGTSKPVIGGINTSELDLNSITITSSGPITIRMTLHDDGYGVPVHDAVAEIGGVLTAAAGSSLTAQGWIDLTDAVPALGPDTGPPAGLLLPIGAIPGTAIPLFPGAGAVFGPGAFAATSPTFDFPLTGAPYSLINQVTIVFTGAGSVSFNLLTRALPEPGTIAVFGLGLAAIAGLKRRRR